MVFQEIEWSFLKASIINLKDGFSEDVLQLKLNETARYFTKVLKDVNWLTTTAIQPELAY